MKYKVGNELVLKGKVVEVDTDSYPYRIKFGEDSAWFSEDMIESSKVVPPEERRKEIEEQIKALNEELESLK